MPRVPLPSRLRRGRLAGWGLFLLCGWTLGCGGGGGGAITPEPEAKARLAKVLHLYQVYVEKNKKGPPNEKALREFGQKLSSKERDEYLIGDDLEGIFTSPRDQKEFVIRYNVKPDPSQMRAIAWEADGKNGMRYVALTNGYVEEYDEETFKEYKK